MTVSQTKNNYKKERINRFYSRNVLSSSVGRYIVRMRYNHVSLCYDIPRRLGAIGYKSPHAQEGISHRRDIARVSVYHKSREGFISLRVLREGQHAEPFGSFFVVYNTASFIKSDS